MGNADLRSRKSTIVRTYRVRSASPSLGYVKQPRVGAKSTPARPALAAAVAVLLAAGFAVVLPGSPAAARPGEAAAVPKVRSAPTGAVPPRQPTVSRSQVDRWSASSSSPRWPAASSTVVELSAAARAKPGGGAPRAAMGLVRAGSSPVWLDAAAGSVGGRRAGRVRVDVVDRAVARAAGVSGLLL